MDHPDSEPAKADAYEAPRVLATFDATEILSEAETGSVIIVIS